MFKWRRKDKLYHSFSRSVFAPGQGVLGRSSLGDALGGKVSYPYVLLRVKFGEGPLELFLWIPESGCAESEFFGT